MKLTVIESPYAGEVEKNLDFARKVCLWALRRGHNPYASHLFYTQFLSDAAPEERKLSIEGGFEWGEHAEEVWFCVPPWQSGLTAGMKLGLTKWLAKGLRVKLMYFAILEDGTCELALEITL